MLKRINIIVLLTVLFNTSLGLAQQAQSAAPYWVGVVQKFARGYGGETQTSVSNVTIVLPQSKGSQIKRAHQTAKVLSQALMKLPSYPDPTFYHRNLAVRMGPLVARRSPLEIMSHRGILPKNKGLILVTSQMTKPNGCKYNYDRFFKLEDNSWVKTIKWSAGFSKFKYREWKTQASSTKSPNR